MAPLKKKSLLGKGSSPLSTSTAFPRSVSDNALAVKGLAAARIIAAKASAAKTVAAKGLISAKKIG